MTYKYYTSGIIGTTPKCKHLLMQVLARVKSTFWEYLLRSTFDHCDSAYIYFFCDDPLRIKHR